MKRACRLSLLCLCTAVIGCVDVDGGAVEARWDLRDISGMRIDCQKAAIAKMGFALVPELGADPCAQEARCTFSCERGVGTTPFIIPEGEYAMTIQAVDAEGRVLGLVDGVTAPAAVVRQVVTGQLTDLNVNLIIVSR
jgi:hypothetical protein